MEVSKQQQKRVESSVKSTIDLPPTIWYRLSTFWYKTVDSLFQDVEGKSLVKSILDLWSFLCCVWGKFNWFWWSVLILLLLIRIGIKINLVRSGTPSLPSHNSVIQNLHSMIPRSSIQQTMFLNNTLHPYTHALAGYARYLFVYSLETWRRLRCSFSSSRSSNVRRQKQHLMERKSSVSYESVSTSTWPHCRIVSRTSEDGIKYSVLKVFQWCRVRMRGELKSWLTTCMCNRFKLGTAWYPNLKGKLGSFVCIRDTRFSATRCMCSKSPKWAPDKSHTDPKSCFGTTR